MGHNRKAARSVFCVHFAAYGPTCKFIGTNVHPTSFKLVRSNVDPTGIEIVLSPTLRGSKLGPWGLPMPTLRGLKSTLRGLKLSLRGSKSSLVGLYVLQLTYNLAAYGFDTACHKVDTGRWIDWSQNTHASNCFIMNPDPRGLQSNVGVISAPAMKFLNGMEMCFAVGDPT